MNIHISAFAGNSIAMKFTKPRRRIIHMTNETITNDIPTLNNNTGQIFDRIFKKILTLSNVAIINLINGLFKTDYPLDSTVTYHWNEFVKEDTLERRLADTILTINHKYTYHLEAQMQKDKTIVFRVFEYGYLHAIQEHDRNHSVLHLPEPIIIYLYYEGAVPDEYVLNLNFGNQGNFQYKVKTFKFLDTTVEELNQNKMIILIPFQLLKLRKLLEKERSEENLELLKNLIQHDIISSINKNLRLGNITQDDARRLKRLAHRLYTHLYSHYEEMEVLNDMTDESLMLDVDVFIKERDEALAEKDKQIAMLQAEKDEQITKLQARIKELEQLNK